ncbi:unnamed protein product [Leptidea sinapis]|uniref:Uncharacterized protein n=1 Tax=Leptidea sinapis TaxID=189913 RepID=A0A5E4QW75_9NEOP|nr:unnamed protein product [Leptidea sinapis]
MIISEQLTQTEFQLHPKFQKKRGSIFLLANSAEGYCLIHLNLGEIQSTGSKPNFSNVFKAPTLVGPWSQTRRRYQQSSTRDRSTSSPF